MADAESIRFTTARTRGVGTAFDCVTRVGPLRTTDRMTIVEWVRAYGYNLEEMTYNDWRARLKEVSEERQDTSAYGLLPLIPELQLASALEESGEETPDLNFDCKNVEENLKGTGITCPPLNAQLLYNYLNHFVESGKIPPPANPSLAAKAGAAY